MKGAGGTVQGPGDSAGLPPGPRMPGALQAIGWARRPYPLMKRCQERFGDVFTLRILHSGTWVFLCDPEDVKRVLTAPAGSLGVALANPLLGPVLGPRSVMLLEEPGHMTRRRLMLPPFHGERMGADAEMMARVTLERLGGWPMGKPFELWPHMQAITQEVIMRSVFGPDDGGRLDHLRLLLGRLTEALNDPRRLSAAAALGPRWLARSGGFRAAMAPVEAALLEEVDRRRRAGENGRRDIVSILIEARYEDGSPLSEGDLRDELMTLLTDGPTSSSLAWVFERLLRHPEKLTRLQDEVRAGEEDTYMDAVVKETLRLCPPVPVVVRRLLEPMELGGYCLPAGTTVAPCVYLIHRNEEIYPNPRHFLPERFLERPPGTYTWIPFGGGTRRCLAASYAELEMKRVLRTVLREVDLHPADADSERARRSAISFSPDKRGRVIAEPRTPAPAPPAAQPWQPSPIYS
ncbi:MAG TPA: cytochrome P450 [Solirubrobacterales bacterium]|nr:cytochrome P450 [Solirubrobacterales bacterium]